MIKRYDIINKRSNGTVLLFSDTKSEKYFGFPIGIIDENYTVDGIIRIVGESVSKGQIYGVNMKGNLLTLNLGEEVSFADRNELTHISDNMSALYDQAKYLLGITEQSRAHPNSIVIQKSDAPPIFEIVPKSDICEQFKLEN